MTTAHDLHVQDATEQLTYAWGRTSLGAILVASSARGVASILLGDDPDGLVQELQRRFPNATLSVADHGSAPLVAEVVGFVEAPGRDLNLQIDIRGTVFQRRVWQALRETPVGTKVTYADLARQIGRPNAVRAVASACAANNVAVVIPCHRVVRSDGSLSGYAWGAGRKRALLDREALQSK